jgi:hypothetical protein
MACHSPITNTDNNNLLWFAKTPTYYRCCMLVKFVITDCSPVSSYINLYTTLVSIVSIYQSDLYFSWQNKLQHVKLWYQSDLYFSWQNKLQHVKLWYQSDLYFSRQNKLQHVKLCQYMIIKVWRVNFREIEWVVVFILFHKDNSHLGLQHSPGSCTFQDQTWVCNF